MFSKGQDSVTFKDVRHLANDFTLVAHYFGITSLPCFTRSPIREDKKPSFGFYTLDGKRVYWTDLATGERGGVYDLLSRLWSCNMQEVYRRIKKDRNALHNSASSRPLKPEKAKVMAKSSKKIECTIREWRDYDYKYWESYGVSKKWLDYAEIHPISHKTIITEGKKYTFKADKYAYVFIERKEGNVTLKIYQPFNTRGFKWANTHDGSVVSLWSKMPEKGKAVCICSSVKDALCLSANTGIPAIALQGEGYNMSNTAINELKRRFENVFVIFDNDEVGIKDGKKFSAKTGFTNIIIPQFEGGKDISDMYKQLGKQEFVNIMVNLIKKPDENDKERSL